MLGLTASPAQAGAVGSVGRLPYLLLALVAGALADRWNRKQVMIACDAGRALAFIGIAVGLWTGHLAVPALYAVALFEGTLFTFFSITEAAALPVLVPTEQLAPAFAQLETTWSASNIIGPAIGGMLYGLGRAIPFAVAAISYAISALSLLTIHAPLQGSQQTEAQALHRDIGTAVQWLWRRPTLRFLSVLDMGFELALSGTILVLIVLLKQHHTGAAGIGLMLAIGAIGTTAGYLIAPHLQHRFSLRRIVITAFWLMACLWLLYAFSLSPLILGAIMAAIGGTASVYIVVGVAYRVAATPDELQGRLNSIFGLLTFGVQSISLAIGGAIAQAFGTQPALITFALCLLVTAASASVGRHLLPDA